MKSRLLFATPSVVALAVASVIASVPARADANSSNLERLRGLSIAQLMNVKVTSVARRPQELLRTAAAVQVITNEEIQRSGATSIPEALRLADNLEVARKNSHDWGISARGFNTDLANKLLVMVDGRSVYTPLFSGVFWDVQDYLLKDIDRIEVISGPGGTLWGANAVNGVINIITESAKNTQGFYAQEAGGTKLHELAGVRYGGALSSDTWFRVYGKYASRGDELMSNGAPGSDSWRQGRAGFRIDSAPTTRDALMVDGDFYDGHEYEPTGGEAQTSGEDVLGRWNRRFSENSDMQLQSYIDHTHLLDPQPALTLGTLQLAPSGVLKDDLTTYDLDFQDRFDAATYHHLVWGLGFRRTHDVVVNAPGLAFLPDVLNQNLYSAFVQDEIALKPNLNVIAGTKLEHDAYTGWEWQPSVRAQWSFADEQSLWAAISRAVRVPSRVDRDLYEAPPPRLTILQGSSTFISEKLIAYEIGYRGQIGARFGSSLSTFYNVYQDLRSTSFTPGPIIPFYFANNLEGDTYGLEFSGDYQVRPGDSLHLGYDLLKEHLRIAPGQVDINQGLNETADPQHQFFLRSSMDLPRHVQFDAALRWIDTLHNNNGPTVGTVPAYFELDSRLAWQVSPQIELSVDGRNLLHAEHVEYGFPGPTRMQIGRSVYAKITWRRER
ncbi:MAG TPA: TonB-dependent receptor [Steroidobacteraceae bacterium]|nr:TonB-dependent receptor [Steroidobacteraceae bacterium]